MRLHTIRALLPLLVLVLVYFLFPPPAKAELVDRVVAVVNDDVITLSELNTEGREVFQNIHQQAPADQVESILLNARQELLSRMIDRILVEQRARELSLSVSEQEVEAALSRILEQNNKTREELKQDLARMGTSEAAYKASLKTQILQSKLVNYEIRSKIVITDEKVAEYYNAHYRTKAQEGSYHILQIGLTRPDDETATATADDLRRRMEEIRKMVLADTDFKETARKFSDLPSAEDGGDIGVFTGKELAAYMRNTILSMVPGEISPVVETPSGFQIFKLLSDRGDIRYQTPLATVAEEIREKLYREQLEQHFEKWVSALRAESFIKTLL